jgi:hypothetical protein
MSSITAKPDLLTRDSHHDMSTLQGSGYSTPAMLTPGSEGDFDFPPCQGKTQKSESDHDTESSEEEGGGNMASSEKEKTEKLTISFAVDCYPGNLHLHELKRDPKPNHGGEISTSYIFRDACMPRTTAELDAAYEKMASQVGDPTYLKYRTDLQPEDVPILAAAISVLKDGRAVRKRKLIPNSNSMPDQRKTASFDLVREPDGSWRGVATHPAHMADM